MKIWKIHSFLTYPAKALDDKPPIRGAEVTSGTRLYGMLEEVFEKSSHECNIEISFNSESGSPTNASRSIIVNYVKKPTIPKGRKIAKQLQSVTTHRSGMGLLFLVLARSRKKSALLVSRFPADVGVLAEEAGKDLSVEFVEKVFMKNAKSYKAALYEGKSIDSGFWDGRATDKQILKRDETLSEYWIRDFLQSDFRTTPEAGTRRLAVALRNAVKSADNVAIKTQIAAASQLVNNLPPTNTSVADICRRFNLSQEAQDVIYDELPNEATKNEKFIFSAREFTKFIQYRSIELDNGGQVVAEASKFDDIFDVTPGEKKGSVVVRTEGEIIDQQLRKRK